MGKQELEDIKEATHDMALKMVCMFVQCMLIISRDSKWAATIRGNGTCTVFTRYALFQKGMHSFRRMIWTEQTKTVCAGNCMTT